MKKEQNKEPLFKNNLLMLFGIIIIISGVSAIALKLFGHPFLFEGIMMIIMGVIVVALANAMLAITISMKAFGNTLEILNNLIKRENPLSHNSEIITISDQTSPEKLEEFKKLHPQLSKIFETLKNGIEGNIKKDLKDMNLSQLKVELKQAIENDDFETAAKIKILIENKNNTSP